MHVRFEEDEHDAQLKEASVGKRQRRPHLHSHVYIQSTTGRAVFLSLPQGGMKNSEVEQ